jgi:hypothetical protein
MTVATKPALLHIVLYKHNSPGAANSLIKLHYNAIRPNAINCNERV